MGYSHRKVAEDSQTTVYERTDEGLFGWGILAAGSKDYVAIDNQTGSAVSGSTVGEARVKLEQLDVKFSLRESGQRPHIDYGHIGTRGAVRHALGLSSSA